MPLADALLHGRLYIGPEYGYLEHAPGPAGGGYMPYPPAPVLFVLPVVALFGLTVDQSIAAAIIGAANILLLWLVFVTGRDADRPLLAAGRVRVRERPLVGGRGGHGLAVRAPDGGVRARRAPPRAARDASLPGRSPARARRSLARARRPDDASVPGLYGRWPVHWPPKLSAKSILPLIPFLAGFAIPVVVTMAYNVRVSATRPSSATTSCSTRKARAS